MNEANPKSAVELELKRLEKRLEDLIVTVQPDQGREPGVATAAGGARPPSAPRCLQKNEQVRARVEAMIGRLKSMEQA